MFSDHLLVLQCVCAFGFQWWSTVSGFFLIADNLESSLKIHIAEDLAAGFKSARFVNLNVY